MFKVGGIGMVGTTADGEAMARLVLETPSQVSFGGHRLDQEELERVHLEKYRFDVLTSTGVLPFDQVKRGANPPDFVVSTPSGEERIECTGLTLQKRRDAFALFDRFKARLLQAAQEESFTNLENCMVAVWFGNGEDLPPRSQDEDTVRRFVEALRGTRVDRAAVAALSNQIAKGEFPETFPAAASSTVSVDDCGGCSVNPVDSRLLGEPFGQAAGFDVQLNMSLTVTSSDVQAELQRIVKKKDETDIDRLLVSVGAPDQSGSFFPGETLVVEQLPPAAIATQHIETVTIHNYQSGAIRDL